jgi:hypothetical protein
MATTSAQQTSATAPGLKRSLSVWSAVGLSLAFLIAAVGVLLVAYTFVRLCQYYRPRRALPGKTWYFLATGMLKLMPAVILL